MPVFLLDRDTLGNNPVIVIIRVGKRLVNSPSFLVRVESEKNIDFASTSPLGGGRAGR